ncbi:MAG: RNA polymerase sigma factor SigZ [Formivibrio sp.]|nr:RNA polymerase sigma factor SigZ [Formivibrio sp.]
MSTLPGTPNCLMQVWHAHEHELRGWLGYQLRNDAMAEDLLQDVFIKAVRQRERFCGIENARAWLFEVTRNTLSDHLRRKREMVELPDDLVAEPQLNPAVDSLATCLPRVLTELNEADRDAITCCDLEGMSQEDYAHKIGLSLPAAKSRVQRARKRLKAQLASSCRVRFDETGRVCCFVPRPILPETAKKAP